MDIKNCLVEAINAVKMFNYVWRSQWQSTKIKLILGQSCVLSTPRCGPESWRMTEGDLSRVPVFHTNIIFNNQLLVQCQEGHVGTIPSEGNNRACLEEGALQHYVCGTQLKGGGKRGRPLQRARRAKSHTWYEYLKNRFRVATHQFSNRSQVM